MKSSRPGSSVSATIRHEDIEEGAIKEVVMRMRPKVMTVTAVLASLILWESWIGSDVMKPIAAPILGAMTTSTIHILNLVPVFFPVIRESTLRAGSIRMKADAE